MPVQKGKRRKRPRRRGSGGLAPAADEVVEPSPAVGKRAARPIMRRGWEPPLWVNATVGVVLFVLGIFFMMAPNPGFSGGVNVFILLGYFALAGLYLGKALRQYRRRRQP